VRSALHACGDELIAGLAWGCRGIAARELARAILADATGSPAVAERYCREMTHALIADLPRAVIEEQVTNGIAVRMSLLYLLLGGAGTQTGEATGAEPAVVRMPEEVTSGA